MRHLFYHFESHLYVALHWILKFSAIGLFTLLGYLSLMLPYLAIFENGQRLNNLSWLELFSLIIVFFLIRRLIFYCRHAQANGLKLMIRLGIACLIASCICCSIYISTIITLVTLNSFEPHSLTDLFNMTIPAEVQLSFAVVYFLCLYFCAPAILIKDTSSQLNPPPTSSSSNSTDIPQPATPSQESTMNKSSRNKEA